MEKLAFSDEKTFTLDGSDGFEYFWHDLRKEPMSIVSCQSGAAFDMIRACFSFHGKRRIAFLDGRQNSFAYDNTLQTYLLEFGDLNNRMNWKF